MWRYYRGIYVDAIETMEDMEAQLNVLMDYFGPRVMDGIDIDSPEFKHKRYDLDLIDIENLIVRLRELISQYLKEEDERYEKQRNEET